MVGFARRRIVRYAVRSPHDLYSGIRRTTDSRSLRTRYAAAAISVSTHASGTLVDGEHTSAALAPMAGFSICQLTPVPYAEL